MKKFMLLVFVNSVALAQFNQSASAQEVILNIKEEPAYFHEHNILVCDLPEVTRGDGPPLVKHNIFVEAYQRFSLSSDHAFFYSECESYKERLGQELRKTPKDSLSIKVRVTEKLVTHQGQYAGQAFCYKNHVQLIETDILNHHYSNTIELSQTECSTAKP